MADPKSGPAAGCTWPPLAPRYDTALHQAVEFIIERFDPVVDQLDNAVDLLDIDLDNAELTLQLALNVMIEYAFLSQDRYLPRPKERLRELVQLGVHTTAVNRALLLECEGLKNYCPI